MKVLKNNKGYMLVEIIVASVIAFSIAYYLLNLVYKFKNINEDVYESTYYNSMKVNFTKNVYNDMENKSVYYVRSNTSGNDKTVDFLVGEEKRRLRIKGKDLEYGELNETTGEIIKNSQSYYKKTIPNYMEINNIAMKYEDHYMKIKISVDNIYNNKKNNDINLIFNCTGLKGPLSIPDEKYELQEIGYLGFAVAGANNATHGDAYEQATREITLHWVKRPPTNTSKYNEVIQQLINTPNNGINSENDITNISGSELNTSNGILRKTYLGFFSYGSTGSVTNITDFDGKILLIRPDFKYHLIEPKAIDSDLEHQHQGFFDISQYMPKDNPDGWYYVSFIGGGLTFQTAWGIFAEYENHSLPLRRLAIIKKNMVLQNGTTANIDFNEEDFDLQNDYELAGMVLSGGSYGWSDPTKLPNSITEKIKDKIWAKLDNGTDFQLYEMDCNGKKIFNNRTSSDFFNGTFNTTNNLVLPDDAGGELDIFSERIPSSCLGNRKVIGYKVQKVGNDPLHIGMFGLAQEIK